MLDVELIPIPDRVQKAGGGDELLPPTVREDGW